MIFKNAFIAVTAAALLITAPFATASKHISEIAPLPVAGVSLVETNDGKRVLMSSNGRFVFTGVFDTWNDRNILTTGDVKKYAQRIDLRQLSLNLDDLHHYQYGEGEKQAVVFVDPNCAYCRKLIDSIGEAREDYTFILLPVGLLGKPSQQILNNLSCASDDEALEAIMTHQYDTLKSAPKGCQPQKQMKTLATARVFGIDVVPFSISPHNIVKRGGFRTKEAFIQYLEAE